MSACSIKRVDLRCGYTTMRSWLEVIAAAPCALTHLALQTIQMAPNDGENTGCSPLSLIVSNSADCLTEFCMSSPTEWLPTMPSSTKLPALGKMQMSSFTETDLISFCTAAPNLQDITLMDPNCKDVGLAAIGQHCHLLESFSCTYAHEVRNLDAGIAAIARGCPQLKRLNLSYCPLITGAGLTAIVAHCAQLEVLVLRNYNAHVTDASLLELAHSACAHRLQVLSVEGCQGLTGTGLAAVATHCRDLRSLNIQHCRMPQLEKLDINNGHQAEYTCEGMLAIAERCEKRKVLYLVEFCDEIVNKLTEAPWKKLRPGLEIHRGEELDYLVNALCA